MMRRALKAASKIRAIVPAMLVATASLTACAGGGPVENTRKPRPEDIARQLNCANNEVAVCIEINCEPEDYQCTPRGSARDLLSGEFEPPQR